MVLRASCMSQTPCLLFPTALLGDVKAGAGKNYFLCFRASNLARKSSLVILVVSSFLVEDGAAALGFVYAFAFSRSSSNLASGTGLGANAPDEPDEPRVLPAEAFDADGPLFAFALSRSSSFRASSAVRSSAFGLSAGTASPGELPKDSPLEGVFFDSAFRRVNSLRTSTRTPD
eukprot:GEMP01025206.1.p1 GENE.GEMP01025206.1~~GEMP01025206.1.p1  ORF type:complete len:174 (-),score=20.61 GEMP01025206.1:423-944(-)